MLRSLMASMAVSMLMAGAAQAQCPAAATKAELAALGPVMATDEAWEARRAVGPAMFDQPVTHVLVEREEGRVKEIWFRLGEQISRNGELSPDLESRFSAKYGASACADLTGYCAAYPGTSRKIGRLHTVRLGIPEVSWFGWQGEGALELASEWEKLNRASAKAVYLICEYNIPFE